MTTITKTDDRRVSFSIEEGYIVICESDAYSRPGYARRTWDKTIIGLSLQELREIIDRSERELSTP